MQYSICDIIWDEPTALPPLKNRLLSSQAARPQGQDWITASEWSVLNPLSMTIMQLIL